MLFAAVNVARKLDVDPELALRAAAERFRGRVEAAAALAAGEHEEWNDLRPERQLGYYAQVRLRESGDEDGRPSRPPDASHTARPKDEQQGEQK